MFKVQPFAFQPNGPSYVSGAGTGHRTSVPSATVTPADQQLNQLSREFSYASLKEATSAFDKNNVLGTGSFGSVHRGKLPDGTHVAIKVIGNPQISGFENEVKILSKFRHPNLVMLLGFARNGTERLLVYECMGKGDCERILKDRVQAPDFTWQRRLSVLLDACRGLTYMLTSEPIAFHRDIKPSNILVNDDWVGKMADFGLACELPSTDMTSIKVPTSAGTMGYACPIYVQTGTVSEASEIYSFGICILEFLTGQPPTMNNHLFPGQVVHLVEKINGNLSSLVSLADKRVGWPEPLAQSLGRIVFDCCHKPVAQRVGFLDVVKQLRSLHEQYVLKHSASPLMPPLPLNNFNQFQAAMTGPNKPEQVFSKPAPALELPPLPRESRISQRPYLEIRSVGNPSKVRILELSELESDQNNQPDGVVIVGRNRQTDLFSELLQSDTLRLCVSRDHFEIRRDITGQFVLANLSGNGTVVEGRGFLERKNECIGLHDGDVIKLVQTAMSGAQTPFLEIVFRTGSIRSVDEQLKCSLVIRNLETNLNETFDFVLAEQTSVQVIGRNTANGIFSRLLRSQERHLQLIDGSHFAVFRDSDMNHIAIRPISEKGIIVGSEFLPAGKTKIEESGSADVFIPGIPHLVVTIRGKESACTRNIFENARMSSEQSNIGRTMIGVPSLLPTSRAPKSNAYPVLIR